MNTNSSTRTADCGLRNRRRALLAVVVAVFSLQLSTLILSAFPPALPHTIYGMARDEYGNPLATNATITLTTTAGVSISCKVLPGLEPGVNYRLVIPMDTAIRSDFYKPVALQATVPFRLRVTINSATFLPLEMSGDASLLGQPGKQTRMDLTLGEDTNGNGLPDAWERAIIAARGWNVNLADLNPNATLGANGATLLQEYVAGTYGFEDGSGLSLAIVRVQAGTPILEFFAVRGRTYTVVGSRDLKTWTPVPFLPLLAGASDQPITAYLSPDVRLLQVSVPTPSTGGMPLFYKLQIR